VPTYQYACTSCDHTFEQVQSFHDDPLTVCPACEGRLRKVFNAVGVVFKGSGFYRTDSRADSSAKNGSSGADSTKADSKSSDGKASDGKSTDSKGGDSKTASTGKAKADSAA
jgi:putative FmdB family regulatory protein